MEIGITAMNPDTIDFPSCAQKLTNGTWVVLFHFAVIHTLASANEFFLNDQNNQRFVFLQIWSGTDILKDGDLLLECYGGNLDTLNETDRIGIMRTAQNDLMFSVNGEAQGIAATNIPVPCWAVVSLYGKCTQISICIDELPIVVSSTAIPSTSTAPISAITYDIDHFIPNFQDPISITADAPMTTLISGRRTESFSSNGNRIRRAFDLLYFGI